MSHARHKKVWLGPCWEQGAEPDGFGEIERPPIPQRNIESN